MEVGMANAVSPISLNIMIVTLKVQAVMDATVHNLTGTLV
jgi:hypothetical protein